MVIRLIIAIILGIIVAFLARLVFNDPIASLLGLLAGLLYFFGDRI